MSKSTIGIADEGGWWRRVGGTSGLRYCSRVAVEQKSNVLFYLLPAKSDVQLTTRLRCARQYPTICALTNRYRNSFILFGLNNF